MKRIIPIIMVLLMIGTAIADITGGETMVRTGPGEVETGSTFQLTYTVSGASGGWGASIVDVATGGCTFPSGNAEYRTVMLSEDGDEKIINVKAPSNSGACIFSGDYKFGELDIKDFQDLTVIVGNPECIPAWQCEEWSAWSDSTNECGTRTRTCVDDNECPGNDDKLETQNEACPGEEKCEFWEKEKDGECELNTGLLIVIFLFIVFFRMAFK